MERPWNRRAFLCRGLGAVVLTPSLLACGERVGRPEEREASRIDRPLLLPLGEDAVYARAPARERPLAYVSVSERSVFVDPDFRDRIYWLLDAHISVSTGLWRLPLRGDPATMPLVPGDTIREFEERDMRSWDPATEPAEGDSRVVRGSVEAVVIDFSCTPVQGVDAWCSGGPFALRRSGRPVGSDAMLREHLATVGSVSRFSDRDCRSRAAPARLVTWAYLD